MLHYVYYSNRNCAKNVVSTVACVENTTTDLVKHSSYQDKNQYLLNKRDWNSDKVFVYQNNVYSHTDIDIYTLSQCQIIFLNLLLVQVPIKIDTKDEEIMYLREIIHKLNSELSRCQNNNNLDNRNTEGLLENNHVVWKSNLFQVISYKSNKKQ